MKEIVTPKKAAKEIFNQMSEENKQNFIKEDWKEGIGNMIVDDWKDLDVNEILEEVEKKCFPTRAI